MDFEIINEGISPLQITPPNEGCRNRRCIINFGCEIRRNIACINFGCMPPDDEFLI